MIINQNEYIICDTKQKRTLLIMVICEFDQFQSHVDDADSYLEKLELQLDLY